MTASWMGPLASLAKETARLGLTFPDEKASMEAGAALAEHYAGNWHLGVLWNDVLWAACAERVRGLRLFAEAPAVATAHGVTESPGFYFAPERPDRLWYAPSASMPAALFVALPATPQAVERALVELGPRATRPSLDERRVVRAYMGNGAALRVPSPYSGELEEAGPHELDRHFNFSPTLTPHTWSGAYDDDPLRGRTGLSAVEMVALARELRQQPDGAWSRFTRRSFFSESQVTIEMHDRREYFWHVVYRPATISRDTVAAFNELLGYRFPLDLPVDVVSALCGFEWIDLAWMEAEIAKEEEPRRRAAAQAVALAIASDDLELATRLGRAAIRRGADDAVAVAEASMRFHWEFLLAEAREPLDPATRARVDEVLLDGIPAPELTEHGEPWDIYGAGDEEDDDDRE